MYCTRSFLYRPVASCTQHSQPASQPAKPVSTGARVTAVRWVHAGVPWLTLAHIVMCSAGASSANVSNGSAAQQPASRPASQTDRQAGSQPGSSTHRDVEAQLLCHCVVQRQAQTLQQAPQVLHPGRGGVGRGGQGEGGRQQVAGSAQQGQGERLAGSCDPVAATRAAAVDRRSASSPPPPRFQTFSCTTTHLM